MDQYFNDSQNEFLWTLLANPADDVHSYTYNLQRLVNDFPQSGILQALFAHASIEKNLKQASVYFDPKLLYKLINTPTTFGTVPEGRIFIQSGICKNELDDEQLAPGEASEELQEENVYPINNENYFEDKPAIEINSEELIETESIRNGEIDEHQPIDANVQIEKDLPVNYITGEINTDEPSTALADQNETVLTNDEDYQNRENTDETAQTLHAAIIEKDEEQIEEEIFDEIVGIDQIIFNSAPNNSYPIPQEEVTTPQEEVEAAKGEIEAAGEEVATDEAPTKENEQEELITEHIASTDFFMFDGSYEEHMQGAELENNNAESSEKTFHFDESKFHLTADAKRPDVSKYHDEKMPYSFMWWLDKTRREHASLYQPYVKNESRYAFAKARKSIDELQHQYYENIFHLTSLEELDKSTAHQAAAEPGIKKKEQRIIERFIQEDPQIKPQSSDKIDNENKAKRSSEDSDEIVTETLAHIYTEQMLYHKAIAAYKKLMLKFPEKSRYFADKIEQIEKKIN